MIDRITKLALRQQRAEGYSVGEIAQRFDLPKSTVYDHVKNVAVQKPAPTLSRFGDEMTDRVAEFVFYQGLAILCGTPCDQYQVREENAEHDAHTLADWNGKTSAYLFGWRKDGFTVTYFNTEEDNAVMLVFTERF